MSKISLDKISDLTDPKALELARNNFRSIADITRLYNKFAKLGQGGYLRVSVIKDTSANPTDVAELRRQFIAAAIVNYELGHRDRFELLAEDGSYLVLWRAHPSEVYKKAGDDVLRLASDL